MNRKIFNIAIVLLVFFYSCKKDKDEVKPTINVTAPFHLQQINGIETVQVTASISDDRNIEQVRVSLRNGNDIPVLSTITENPNTSTYNLNVLYEFDDIHLTSGQYYFSISASDGENITTTYVTIILNETAKTKQGTFVIGNSGSSSDIYILDNSFNGNFYQSIVGDFKGAAVNSYDQQLIHVSSVTGSISAIDLSSGIGSWNIPIITSPPTPFYTGVFYGDQTIYVGNYNGVIQGYNKFGAGNYNGSANLGYHMESALVHNDYYFVTEQKPLSGSSVQLVLLWMASGFLAQQTPINEDIKGIYSQTTNTIVVLTNDATSNGKLIFYDIPTGATSSPFNINVGQIDDCIEISSGIYLVVESGDLTLINANNYSNLPYLTGVNASRIWYDDFTNELYVANGNSLDIYNYSSKMLVGNYTHTSVIKDVLFWYNK